MKWKKRHHLRSKRPWTEGPATRAAVGAANESCTAGPVLTRLSSHAAVRLDEIPGHYYDSNDLPAPRTQRASRTFAFGRSMRGLASYLITRINPHFQECHVVALESLRGLYLEVRPSNNPSRVVFDAPFATLVDVCRDSVVERETVTFSQLPHSHGSTATAVSDSTHSNTQTGGGLTSNLLRAYGDIGLNLTFKVPKSGVGGNASEKPFTKVRVRFVNTSERDRWLSFCTDAYVGLLLDSIRSGEDAVRSADAPAQGHGEGLPAGAKLSSECVDRYVDWFLSTPDRSVECKDCAAVGAPPSNGMARVRIDGGREHLCKLRLGSASCTEGLCLLVHRASLSNRLRLRGARESATESFSLKNMKVYVDDNTIGTNLFIESQRTWAKGETRGKGSSSRPVKALSQYLAESSTGSDMHTVMLEMCTGSTAERAEWLNWFERALEQPVLSLHAVRQPTDGLRVDGQTNLERGEGEGVGPL